MEELGALGNLREVRTTDRWVGVSAFDQRLLNDEERRWINDYHRWVKAKLGSKLGEKDRRWLNKACRRI